jgi:hypothetical protein
MLGFSSSVVSYVGIPPYEVEPVMKKPPQSVDQSGGDGAGGA